MKKNDYFILAGIFFLSTIVIWGCNGPRPTTMASFGTMTVHVPVAGAHGSAVAAPSNDEILYHVTGPNMFPLDGTTGVISDSSISGGTASFTVNIPQGSQRVIALQVNDVTTKKPIALGATQFDLSGNTAADVTVELGSLTKTCYTQTVPSFDVSYSYSYSFDSNSFNSSYSGDISVYYDSYNGGLYLNSPSYSPSIAYMGSGNLVDFAYVPGDSSFSYSSEISKQEQLFPTPVPTPNLTPSVSKSPAVVSGQNSLPNILKDIQTGDVYCVKLSSIPGGHAWVLVTDGGLASPDIYYPYYIVNTSPSFIFRTNSALPFYGFEQTTVDVQGGCP